MCYLFIKTAERMHTPDQWWEKIKVGRGRGRRALGCVFTPSLPLQLSPSYAQALKDIDKHLEFWPKYMIHRNKQRLTKIHQYLIRMRKLRSKVRCVVARAVCGDRRRTR